MRHLVEPSARAQAWAARLASGSRPDEGSLDRLAELAEDHLTDDAIAEIEALSSGQGEHGALLIEQVPVDDVLVPTPTSERAPGTAKPTRVSEGALLGIGRLLGEPVAYAAEKQGALVQDVFPIERERGAPSNSSSSVDLGLHTELVFSRERPDRPMHEDSPDFLLMLCLRPDPGRTATTVVAEAAELCRLAGQAVEVLRRRDFELRAPYSFTRDGDGSRPWVGPVPLVSGPSDAPRIAFDLACGVRALTVEGGRALDALRHASASDSVRHEVHLDRGNLLVIDNRRCAHGRSAFPASFDGRDRWLQRAYVRRSLDGLGGYAGTGSRRVV